MNRFYSSLALACLLATSALTGLARAQDTTPQSAPCPAELPTDARCFTGEDGQGAFYWMALPAGWDNRGVLVMHAHGGPANTGPAAAARSEEDLKRWAVTVKAGHAWAGSTYRRGGYGVTMAAEDTERLRRIFVRHFGPPRRTLLHGQSYGGSVAAKAAGLYATVDGQRGPYDGVLLTSGMLGGGNPAYDFRLDLRVVYQYVCNNHPRPDEPPYPLWLGLPTTARLTRAELARRVDDCTGVNTPVASRTAQQAANLATLVNVIRIPESSLVGHLNWATWLFQDLVQLRLGGKNPFGNVGVVYRGSGNDAALNAGVLRYAADPQAVAELAQDSTPDGRVTMPILSLHAVQDPVAFVELESFYRGILERAGTADLLVQTFSDESEHSYLADAQYPALFSALLDWVDHGRKPTPQQVATRCTSYEAAYASSCRLLPGYAPQPLASRVPPRAR
ncbi:MAG: alpha/beta hydrolase family protein [Polaromonas sp.]